jgi:hypothetical protein
MLFLIEKILIFYTNVTWGGLGWPLHYYKLKV